MHKNIPTLFIILDSLEKFGELNKSLNNIVEGKLNNKSLFGKSQKKLSAYYEKYEKVFESRKLGAPL